MSRVALFAVALPVVVLAVWTAKLQAARTYGTEIQLAITGNDPRSLLSGHYLIYRIDYGLLAPPSAHCVTVQGGNLGRGEEDACVCLERATETGNYEATWAGACDVRDATTCSTFLRGRCRYGRFDAGIERMYIPEEYSMDFAQVPAGAVIKASVTTDGSGQVKQMLVGGVDVLLSVKQTRQRQ